MSYTSHFDPDKAAERFIRYASIYTQSEEGHPDTPSTVCQFDLARLLTRELTQMGASEVFLDEDRCYVYASIPGNIPARGEVLRGRSDTAAKRRDNSAPVIGLVAHMDTTDDVDASAHPVITPRRIDRYDGTRITLNEAYSMGPGDYPDLARRKGATLIVTDGTTVLGGDDKAGIVQIMETADFLLHHPEIAHGTVRILFTPDEEVGNGTAGLDYERFAADYAYTVDSGSVGCLEYECFHAASAKVHVRGLSTHPGSAKGRMRNALLVAMEFNALLPPEEIPARTEGREGFYHLTEMNGTTEEAVLEYIIRDHDRAVFERRKELLRTIAARLNDRYGEDVVTLELRESYRNMAEKILPHRHLIENAIAAMEELGITPVVEPVRGGTDGAALSFHGIPCPNLGTGAHNIHSRFEYVVAEEMAAGSEILLRILNRYAFYELDPPVPPRG